jgi:hypothetical protein
MNEIFSLQADEGSLRKIFDKRIKAYQERKFFNAQRHEIENLSDLHSLITRLRNDVNFDYIFIRGNPKQEGRQQRLKINTYDVKKNWAMLDVDNLPMQEGDDWDFQTIRKRLIENIDFIKEDTAMIIDKSSSAQMTRKGEEAKRIYKVHVFVWFSESISCKELFQRLKAYDYIDEATALVTQSLYFEEPYYNEMLWNYEGQERTCVFQGKDCDLPSLSHASPRRSSVSKNVISSQIDIKRRTAELFNETQIEGQRHKALYRFFCHIVATGQDKRLWIGKYWNSEGRDKDEKDTIDKVEKVMKEAQNYIYSQFIKPIDIRENKMVELNTRFLTTTEIPTIEGRTTLVKSEQGTGKTFILKDLIPKDASVLVIGHRCTLLRQTADELNLFVYEDMPKDKRENYLWLEDRLVITFDSLRFLIETSEYGERLEKRNYDYVIIDESEQFLGELLTTDRMAKQVIPQTTSDVFYYVGKFIRNAKSIYCADADLSDLTILFLQIWRTEKFNIYENAWNVEGRTLRLLPSHDSALEQIYEELDAHRRVYVTCETKIGAKNVEHQILIGNYKDGKRRNVLCITGDNRSQYKRLISNPNKEIPLLFAGTSRINNDAHFTKPIHALIVSPIVDTGFSIGSKEDNENRFHTVIGIFNHNEKIYSGAKIKQALQRVRNADSTYAFIQNFSATNHHDIEEILSLIDELSPKNKTRSNLEKLKRMVLKNKAISDANRMLNVLALFDLGGWNVMKATNQIKGMREWMLVESQIRREEEEKLINATDLTDKEYEKSLLEGNFDGVHERVKHEIKKCFYEGDITEENKRFTPITRKEIKRYARGDIAKKHEKRELLRRNEDELNKIWEREGDLNYDKVLRDSLLRIFDVFGFDIAKYNEPIKELTLFAFQIPDDTAQYLFNEDNAHALSFILKYYQNLKMSEATLKLIDENKLRLFCNLAKVVDYDCKYVDYTNKDEVGEKEKWIVYRKFLQENIKRQKSIAEKFGNELNDTYKGLIERIGDKEKTKQTDYLEKLKIAISENRQLLKEEETYAKQSFSHITLKDYKPHYTNYLSNFNVRYQSLLSSYKETKKNLDKKSDTPNTSVEEIYDL